MLDLKVKEMRESWAQGGSITYQLIPVGLSSFVQITFLEIFNY